MLNLKLNPDGDLDLTGGSMTFIDGDESIAQKVETVLQTGLGEYFLNENIGIDYIGTVFQKGTPLNLINQILSTAILGVEGVVAAKIEARTFESATRTLSLFYECKTVNSSSISNEISVGITA